MFPTTRRAAKIAAAAAVIPASLLVAAAAPTAAGAAWAHPASRFEVRQILFGGKLRHTFVPAGSARRRSEPLTQPDDITVLGRDLFAGFQNGVGPQGQAVDRPGQPGTGDRARPGAARHDLHRRQAGTVKLSRGGCGPWSR
jgi:hypothetical protein